MSKIKIPIGADNNNVSTIDVDEAVVDVTKDVVIPNTDEPVVVVVDEPVVPDVVKPTIIINNGTEDVTYDLNDSGDAIDKEGKILYTSAQLAAFESGDDEGIDISDIITQASSLSGIQILDDKGKPKVYENSIEGIAQRESDIKRLGYKEAESKAIENFFASNPELAAQYEYKRVYGSLDGFANHIDYTTLTIDVNNVDQQYDMIVKAELKKGSSPERAKRLADLSKSDNTLLTDSQESLTYLASLQKADKETANSRESANLAAAIQKENEYFGVAYDEGGNETVLNVEGSIYDMIVTKGSIGGLKIPIEGVTIKDPKGTPKTYTRRQIFDYVSTPVKEINGEYFTQAQLDEYARISNKDELVSTFIRNLFGGDLSSLITTSKLQDKANQVRRINITSKSSKHSTSGTSKVIIPIKSN